MLIAAYWSIILLGFFFVLVRPDTALLRGERFFWFTFVFLAGARISVVTSDTRPANGTIAFWVTTLLLSLAARQKWFLLRDHPEKTAAIVESCLTMLLMPFEKNDAGYSLQLGEGTASLRLFPLLPNCSILTFRGERRHPKVRLLRALLVKKFAPVFPRPTIDLR